MHTFHIKHVDAQGETHEYNGLFECAIDAIKDCVATFGFGRIKVDTMDCRAANSDFPRAA